MSRRLAPDWYVTGIISSPRPRPELYQSADSASHGSGPDHWPIRGQYWGHVISNDQSQTTSSPLASDQKGSGQSTDVQLLLRASKSPSWVASRRKKLTGTRNCGWGYKILGSDLHLGILMKDPIKICTNLRQKARGRVQDEILALVQKAAMQHNNHVDIYHFKSAYLDVFCS